MNKLKKVILAGLMLAATIVLSRFLSIRTPIVVISFSFLPMILTAMLLGTSWAVFVAAMADLLGALLFPFGAYFFGYTVSAALTGVIYGIFLRKSYKLNNKQFIWRLIVSCILVSVICNMVLNTLWIYVTTKKAVMIFAPTRIIKELILLPIKVIIIQGLHFTFIKSKTYNRLFNDIENNTLLPETEITTSKLINKFQAKKPTFKFINGNKQKIAKKHKNVKKQTAIVLKLHAKSIKFAQKPNNKNVKFNAIINKNSNKKLHSHKFSR